MTARALRSGILGRKLLLTPSRSTTSRSSSAELDPEGSTGAEQYAHGDSEEFFVVIRGTVHLELGDEHFELEAGDSSTTAARSHTALESGGDIAEVMWMISPPSY